MRFDSMKKRLNFKAFNKLEGSFMKKNEGVGDKNEFCS